MKDCPRKDIPSPMDNVQNFTFVGAAVGRNHTILLTGKSKGDNFRVIEHF